MEISAEYFGLPLASDGVLRDVDGRPILGDSEGHDKPGGARQDTQAVDPYVPVIYDIDHIVT
jgi:hypothetical protein